MDKDSPFPVFLKEHREALGMNPRQFAEAISAAGGRATTQAVQQWENTTPGQRTTRPSAANRHAIATVLGCDVNELQSRMAREFALLFSATTSTSTAGSSLTRTKSATVYTRFESEITDAIRAKIPEADEYLEKIISPFGMSRRYDYLSPKLAVDWVAATHRYSAPLFLEGHLWKLLWLARLDADTGVARKYLFILILAPDDSNVTTQMKRHFDRLHDEARVFGNTLTLCLVSSPAEAGALVVEYETGA